MFGASYFGKSVDGGTYFGPGRSVIPPTGGGLNDWVYMGPCAGPDTNFSRGWVHFKERNQWTFRNFIMWLKSSPSAIRTWTLGITGPLLRSRRSTSSPGLEENLKFHRPVRSSRTWTT